MISTWSRGAQSARSTLSQASHLFVTSRACHGADLWCVGSAASAWLIQPAKHLLTGRTAGSSGLGPARQEAQGISAAEHRQQPIAGLDRRAHRQRCPAILVELGAAQHTCRQVCRKPCCIGEAEAARRLPASSSASPPAWKPYLCQAPSPPVNSGLLSGGVQDESSSSSGDSQLEFLGLSQGICPRLADMIGLVPVEPNERGNMGLASGGLQHSAVRPRLPLWPQLPVQDAP